MNEKTKTLYGIELKPRVLIKPRAVIDMPPTEGRDEVLRAMRKVMEEHREVLERLAKR